MTTSDSLHLVTVLGTRPEFVKAAALDRAVQARPDHIRETLVHTGQHYDDDMSARFFSELGLTDRIAHLDAGSGSHGVQTGNILRQLDPLFDELQPDIVLVYGDTNSTVAGALAAAKLHLPVAHVEAGLRSFNRRMPEEVNRVVTDHVADLLFCPSEAAVTNLAAEGITAGVHRTGDVNLDVLLDVLGDGTWTEQVISDLGVRDQGFALATVHRAENTDDVARFDAIVDGLSRIAADGLPVVLPAHPRVRGLLAERSLPTDLRVIDPVGFREMVALGRHATVCLTDSGGVQKEMLWLETPCITMRDETEWVETVDVGWNVLVGADADLIVKAALSPSRPEGPPPPVYGDGSTAHDIVDTLIEFAEVGGR